MTMLVCTVGLPGSGKSTWALEWVRQDPAGRARVGEECIRRDSLRPPGQRVGEQVIRTLARLL